MIRDHVHAFHVQHRRMAARKRGVSRAVRRWARRVRWPSGFPHLEKADMPVPVKTGEGD